MTRALQLADLGCSDKDVMTDEKGDYVLVEPSLMDEGESEDGAMVKVYL